jgi:protein TonB
MQAWHPSQWKTLHWALAVSVGAHAALLLVRVADPEALRRAFTDTPLEVILVNARSNDRPVQAQAIAQASLAGGGNLDSGRATSPLPMAPTTEAGDASETTRRQLEQMHQEQQMLLAQVRRELATLPAPNLARDGSSEPEREQEERRRQLVRLLAEIEKRIEQENARPRKRFISPATREAVYAVYYDALRRRIEERGTRDFPQAQGRKLYGELTMNITVDAAGRVVAAEVVQPSSSRVLDQRAVAIVLGAAPYGSFTPAMRREADQIVVTSRFRFTRQDSLETTVSAPGG